MLLQLISSHPASLEECQPITRTRKHFLDAPGKHDPIHKPTPAALMVRRWESCSTHFLLGHACVLAGTQPPASCSGTALQSFESHQQCTDLCSLLQLGRCKGEPLLSAYDETSVFPISRINSFCTVLRQEEFVS